MTPWRAVPSLTAPSPAIFHDAVVLLAYCMPTLAGIHGPSLVYHRPLESSISLHGFSQSRAGEKAPPLFHGLRRDRRSLGHRGPSGRLLTSRVRVQCHGARPPWPVVRLGDTPART